MTSPQRLLRRHVVDVQVRGSRRHPRDETSRDDFECQDSRSERHLYRIRSVAENITEKDHHLFVDCKTANLIFFNPKATYCDQF